MIPKMTEITDQSVGLSIDNFFNNVLRSALKYPETFDISVDLDNKRIELYSNIDSQLIDILNRKNPDHKKKSTLRNIEESLLRGFKSIDAGISSVNIYILKIKIKY
jgi:hypothetical protein